MALMPGVPHRRKAPGTRADERPQRQRGDIVLLADGDVRPPAPPPADADERVHELWGAVVSDPVAMKIVSGCEPVALRRYWTMWGQWWQLADEIADLGRRAAQLTWKSALERRAERRRLRAEMAKLTEDLRRLETDWGLSPVGRLRLGVLIQQARGVSRGDDDVDGGDAGEEVPDPPPL